MWHSVNCSISEVALKNILTFAIMEVFISSNVVRKKVVIVCDEHL